MASYDITILTAAGPQVVSVDAAMYEQDDRGNLCFYKGQENKKVASFRTWDYVVQNQQTPP